MRTPTLPLAILSALLWTSLTCADQHSGPLGVRRLNNLVATLLESGPVSNPKTSLRFNRPTDGWIFVSASCNGPARITLNPGSKGEVILIENKNGRKTSEAMRRVAKGEHAIQVACDRGAVVESLAVRAIPELIHCGLGFNSSIKSYGLYDMAFLEKDVLPNITGTIVPHNIKLTQEAIDDWHRQGKWFIAEVGINGQAKTAEEHFKHWAGYLDKAPFMDGIIVNEFIVNNPAAAPGTTLSPERQQRMKLEQQKYRQYEAAIKMLHADTRYQTKMYYGYVGGSGRKLNQEIVGPTFARTLVDCDYRIALERYLFERSSEKASKEALDELVAGISDWEAKAPGAKEHMVIAFGLFSMPPGGINKLPHVDYHVWMDQQMNVVANNPQLAGIAGIEWWTTILADEETTRFVGKLYRHYAIEGKKTMLTRDPLFMTHIQNADFQNNLEGWTLNAAEPGAIEHKSFPRYGRIEGRYMGLGRPADPEHLGDGFIWMKRSAKGPNTFSQTIKNLEPGRLYSMKMFSCDYNDLVKPAKKTQEQANRFMGKVTLEGVDIDAKKSFTEMYASNPEPTIPVWITYHWTVFRAKGPEAKLTVSDWSGNEKPGDAFGQEQTFNFVEIQPYHE